MVMITTLATRAGNVFVIAYNIYMMMILNAQTFIMLELDIFLISNIVKIFYHCNIINNNRGS